MATTLISASSCLFLDTMDAKDLMTALHNHLWIPLTDDA